MKRAAAIILSLTLLWLQVMASAQTLSTPAAAAACGCCSGKKVCCCVEESAPAAAPVAVAPAPAGNPIDFSVILSKLVVWLLPESAPTIGGSSDGSCWSPAIPLFQRDCALLI